MNLTRAELHAPCNTEEAARTRPVQPKPRPVQPFNTVRVELSTPRATPKISAHASGTCPVLMTRAMCRRRGLARAQVYRDRDTV